MLPLSLAASRSFMTLARALWKEDRDVRLLWVIKGEKPEEVSSGHFSKKFYWERKQKNGAGEE